MLVLVAVVLGRGTRYMARTVAAAAIALTVTIVPSLRWLSAIFFIAFLVAVKQNKALP